MARPRTGCLRAALSRWQYCRSVRAMRDRPGELTLVDAESTEHVARRLLHVLLQARGVRCRCCRTRSQCLDRIRRQGHARQVPRSTCKINAIFSFISAIVGAEKASKAASEVEAAVGCKARACLRARGPANGHSSSEDENALIACIVLLCTVAYVIVILYPHHLSGLRKFAYHNDTTRDTTRRIITNH